MTGRQLRAARALLKWTADDLAAASQVGVATIRRAEIYDDELKGNASTVSSIRRAFEEAGVEFIPENGGGAGVRMRKRSVD